MSPGPEPTGRGVNRYGQTGALTPEKQDRIVQAVKAGNYLKVAAQWAGVGESTLRTWLQRGRRAVAALDEHRDDHLYCPACGADRGPVDLPRPEDPHPCPSCHSAALPGPWELPEAEHRYLAFLGAVTEAESSAEIAAVTHWRAAFPDDWRAARDYLRYRQPERWSPVTRVTVTPEEAERRIQEAFTQVLTSVGVDLDGMGEPLLDGADALDALDLEGDTWPDGEPGDD